MPSTIKGYVLFIVMVYLQCFSMLMMVAIATSGVMRQHLIGKNLHETQRMNALAILTSLDHVALTCIKPNHSIADLLKQSSQVWQESTCFGRSKQGSYYYYHYELETDRCAMIQSGHGRGRAVVYYLQTLAYDHAAVIVQDTVALPSQHTPQCDHALREVMPGRQMLRWLR